MAIDNWGTKCCFFNLCFYFSPSRPQVKFSLGILCTAIKLAGDRRRAATRLQSTVSTAPWLEGGSCSSSSVSGLATGNDCTFLVLFVSLLCRYYCRKFWWNATTAILGSSCNEFLWVICFSALGVLIKTSFCLAALAKAQAMAAVRKANSITALTQTAKLDHALVGDVLKEIFSATMCTQDLMVFHNIMRDVWSFSTLQEPGLLTESERSNQSLVQAACVDEALQLGLVAHPPWMDKIMKLYTLLNSCQGVTLTVVCLLYLLSPSHRHDLGRCCGDWFLWLWQD